MSALFTISVLVVTKTTLRCSNNWPELRHHQRDRCQSRDGTVHKASSYAAWRTDTVYSKQHQYQYVPTHHFTQYIQL